MKHAGWDLSWPALRLPSLHRISPSSRIGSAWTATARWATLAQSDPASSAVILAESCPNADPFLSWPCHTRIQPGHRLQLEAESEAISGQSGGLRLGPRLPRRNPGARQGPCCFYPSGAQPERS